MFTENIKTHILLKYMEFGIFGGHLGGHLEFLYYCPGYGT